MANENRSPGTAAAVPSPAPGGRRARGFGRTVRSFLILSLVAVAALAALYLFVALRWSYSSGERAGYVQKFSKKGWVCKTWEGEIAMANLPGAMPELFPFSVRDDAVAAQINRSLGERVVLSYEQHLGLPSCFGETQYFVTGVRPVAVP
jgi:hypothetical protein